MILNEKDVQSVSFVMENCESMTIPSSCIKSMNATTRNGIIHSFTIVIEDNGIEREEGYDDYLESPVNRLATYDDICNIDFKLNSEGNPTVETVVRWQNGSSCDNNKGQTHSKINYRTISIKIKRW